MTEIKNTGGLSVIRILWLSDFVALPGKIGAVMYWSIPLFRSLIEEINSVEHASKVGLIYKHDDHKDYELHPYGTLVQIKKDSVKPEKFGEDEVIKFLFVGLFRFQVVGEYKKVTSQPFGIPIEAKVKIFPEQSISVTDLSKDSSMNPFVIKAKEVMDFCKKSFEEKAISVLPFRKELFNDDVFFALNAGLLADRLVFVMDDFWSFAFSNTNQKIDFDLKVLRTLDIKERFKIVVDKWDKVLRKAKGPRNGLDSIVHSVVASMNSANLKFKKMEQNAEVGQEEESIEEISDLRNRYKKIRKKLPDEAVKTIEEEFKRVITSGSESEKSVSLGRLRKLISVYELEPTKQTKSREEMKRVLDGDHYGLSEPKKRILQEGAAKRLNPNRKAPILCLIGAPGTGKTSLGQSVARALDRKFTRLSVGGVRDVAEIRGHRRTYIGAIAGRIINNLESSGSSNPVFMIDEIDKISAFGDVRGGDPAAALLEVLDPEQNHKFVDHYLESPVDLSQVFFITTANTDDSIIPALKDRMKFIYLPGYLDIEKVRIAQRFLIPRQLKEAGLLGNLPVKFTKEGILKVINEHTSEAGVRNLIRAISDICLELVERFEDGQKKLFEITKDNISDFLGAKKVYKEKIENLGIGVATGLAWTKAGGEILFIETKIVRKVGSGELIITGQLGDVMEESIKEALSYLRSDIETDAKKKSKNDIHVSVPQGAVSKDGPSAGLAILVALYSLFKKIPVKKELALTGEVTLRGKVDPIGGLKEKLVGAVRAGVKEVVIPKDNKGDLDDLPEMLKKMIHIRSSSSATKRKLKNKLVIYLVDTMDEALNIAFPRREKNH